MQGSSFGSTRRDFLKLITLAGGGVLLPGWGRTESGRWVNDVHSRLTPTRVREIFRPTDRDELLSQLRLSLQRSGGISIAGGRHSMGSQAFGSDSDHFDLTGCNSIGDLDTSAGVVEVDAGATWPDLMNTLDHRQQGEARPWCIVQKQTGADDLTLGGALAANIHGRGLAFAPFVQDVESFRLLTASGEEIVCSRTGNVDWFRLAVGGYGLFGVVTSLRLRLRRRQTLKRVVKAEQIGRVPDLAEQSIRGGVLYGDFQFSTAPGTDGFLNEGVFSTYEPVEDPLPPARGVQGISTELWKKLITLAHLDKAEAFRVYLDFYLRTNGQLYASDRQQMSTYLPDYHEVVAAAIRPDIAQSLVITELYVPRDRLVRFMENARRDLLAHDVDMVYGVVRWIEPDRETFLPWARDRMACVIFNLNVRHDPAGKAKAAADFRRLIDLALNEGGSFYLTYHRHATREQMESAYPEFGQFLAEKERRDPGLVWRSDWYRHCRGLFAG